MKLLWWQNSMKFFRAESTVRMSAQENFIELCTLLWLGLLKCFHCVSLLASTPLQNLPGIPNYCQQDATFLNLFISTDALHVSGSSSAHHHEHITVHTASCTVNQSCCLLQQAAVLVDSTVMCSWWWSEEPSETCRASVEINKLRNVSCRQ